MKKLARRVWMVLSTPAAAVKVTHNKIHTNAHHLIPKLKYNLKKAMVAAKSKKALANAPKVEDKNSLVEEFSDNDFKHVRQSVSNKLNSLDHPSCAMIAYQMETLEMLLRFRYCDSKFQIGSGMDQPTFQIMLNASPELVPVLLKASAAHKVQHMYDKLKHQSFLNHLDNSAIREEGNIDEALKVQQDALHSQLKKGIQFLNELRIRSRIDKIFSFFHMIVQYLKLVDSDQGASMDDIADVIMGFIKQGAGDPNATDAPMKKLKIRMEAKIAKSQKIANDKVKEDNEEMDAKNKEMGEEIQQTAQTINNTATEAVTMATELEYTAFLETKAAQDHTHPLLLFLEESALELLDDPMAVIDTIQNANTLGHQAAAATTNGIKDTVSIAKQQINKSTGGAQSKLLNMLTDPKNLQKIVKLLEKTFETLLTELEKVLHGDFLDSLMQVMHMQMEVYVYAEDAQKMFIASAGLVDFAFFMIFFSIFAATVYGLILSLSAVGYLYGYCKCCASMCNDPDSYLKEDKYKSEGPCLGCFPRCTPCWKIDCCRCQEMPQGNICTRGTCKVCTKVGGCCRWWFCDLKNAFICASIWINCNFCLMVIPLTIAVGLILAALTLWYGSCYGINIMTEAICKMLNTYAHQLEIDTTSIAVCNGQGPCDAVTKSMPIAAGLVGGGTILLFFCQYQILGVMWKNYYWSTHHQKILHSLQKEIDDFELDRQKKWLGAHPGASIEAEEKPLLTDDKDKQESDDVIKE